jgi:DNA-3-methyladenine glycosylase II
MRIIETQADVDEGAAWLAEQSPEWARLVALCSPLPLRRKGEGFAELLSAIVSQQVSTASAAAIWARLTGAGLITQEAVSTAGEEALKAQGLSRPKIRYALALAAAPLDYTALRNASSEDVIKTLTKLPGIGPWSAEIYTMFSLGHADVFAPGDLALQEAAKELFCLEARPSEKELRNMATDWSPWRGVAARGLWAYYRHIKKREGVR